jgi:hypothetical protein
MRIILFAAGTSMLCVLSYYVGKSSNETSITLQKEGVVFLKSMHSECTLSIRIAPTGGFKVEASSSKNKARPPDVSFMIYDYKYPSPGVESIKWTAYGANESVTRYLRDGKTILEYKTPYETNPLIRHPEDNTK